MELLVPIAIIVLLLLANGLFVAAEFAIVGASKAGIEHRAAQGGRLAARVLRVLESPVLQDRYIATTQVGISVASLGLGMYGEHWLAERLQPLFLGLESTGWIAAHAVASVTAVGVLTYLHIVIGEMVPKALALQRAQETALYVSPAIRAIQGAIFPLVVGLNAVGNRLLRAAGVERTSDATDRYHTAEELEFIVRESHEGGLLKGEAAQILRELFEFGDLTAGEVMVPRVLVTGVPVGADAGTLRDIVRAHPHTRYPVYAGDLDHILGSLHIKQVLRHLVSGRPVTAADARALPYLPGPTPLDEVLGAMRSHRAQMAVIMDQHGGTAGIVTMEDLFEEVVGEIDEGRSRAPIVHEGEDRIRVRGTVRLDEAWEALGRRAEHPDVTTISGLVLLELRRPPRPGDVVTWQGVRIEVLSVAGRGVAEAALKPT